MFSLFLCGGLVQRGPAVGRLDYCSSVLCNLTPPLAPPLGSLVVSVQPLQACGYHHRTPKCEETRLYFCVFLLNLLTHKRPSEVYSPAQQCI